MSQPKHGKGWILDTWQVVSVYQRARGFGDDAWLEERFPIHHKPGESADELRAACARESGIPATDIALEAVDL